MQAPQVKGELKRDAFGRVELIEAQLQGAPPARWIRRVAVGCRIPGSGWIARHLLRRERKALARLADLAAVPLLVEEPQLVALPSLDGAPPPARACLVRTFVEGHPLHRADLLPRDFFDHLDALVVAMHARGVCHNDLHKEQNIMVRVDGRPGLIDFQLASVHDPTSASRLRISRERDDLRHAQKHRRRYTRDGRGPDGDEGAGGQQGLGHGLPRSRIARLWRRGGKPVYGWVTRRVLGRWDGEERRESGGAWPRWGAPLGPLGNRELSGFRVARSGRWPERDK